MNLTELMAAVYIETNRPDLVEETQQAVLGSLFNNHTREFFFRDIATTEAVFDQAAYIQNIDIYAFPRWRALSYFRKNDPSLATFQQNPTILPPLYSSGGLPYPQSMKFLEVVTPDNIFDQFDCEKLDICYQAGATLFAKSSTALQYALIGWYQFPNLDASVPVNFDSWIARDFPYAVIYDAASSVLQKIGMTDAARKYDNPETGLATTAIRTLIINNITMQGR